MRRDSSPKDPSHLANVQSFLFPAWQIWIIASLCSLSKAARTTSTILGCIVLVYTSSSCSLSFDSLVSIGVCDQWNVNGTGPLSTNGIEAGVQIRPSDEELAEFEKWPTPHFKDGWESYFKNKADKPVMHYSVISGWLGDHMLM